MQMVFIIKSDCERVSVNFQTIMKSNVFNLKQQEY